MKEKAKAAPKELVRRGLDDGTERLRGQLRETAQRGQASDYGGGSPDAASPTAVIAQINSEYADRLSSLQTGGTYDRVEIQGSPPSWADVFAVFAAKTAGAADGESVAVLDTDTVEKLRTVFWDMTKITTAEADVEHPAEGDADAWTEKVLTITVTPRTPDDMRVFYAFTDQQNAALDELLTAANREMWNLFKDTR